jgi:hypothetical protein
MSAVPDRDDPQAAEAVMRRLCPDEALRRFLMVQLLRSAAVAEQAGPRSWAVTLFDRGFRLNVGQVEAFTYLNRVVGWFMLGTVPDSVYTVGEVLDCSFRSLPQPQRVFYGSPGELQRLQRQLTPAHEEFLRTAATTAAGKPRRCPYARYHSPGLYTYAVRSAGVMQAVRAQRARKPR